MLCHALAQCTIALTKPNVTLFAQRKEEIQKGRGRVGRCGPGIKKKKVGRNEISLIESTNCLTFMCVIESVCGYT